MTLQATAVAPANVDDLAGVMRDADAARSVVRVRGGGSKWTWGADAADPDLVVDTGALTGVVEHAAGDLVVTARAGTPLAELQAAVAEAGQWLALDPPEHGATVGGVVATAASGPRRLRYGTPRDVLIGVTVVLADGTVARSGGKVVKNVAGYDLGKLVTGSFGTLAVIAECTFRLHPVAPATRVVSVATDDPAPLVRALLHAPVEPAAIEWYDGRLHVVLESVAAAVEAQAGAVRDLAGGGEVGDATPAGWAERPWRSGDVALKVTHRLSALGPVLALLRGHVPAARVRAHGGSGVVLAGWDAGGSGASPADVAAAVGALRAEVAAHDGTVVVVDAPADVKAAVDVWGPVRGLEVMRRVKERFDPQARLAPGRFVGGI